MDEEESERFQIQQIQLLDLEELDDDEVDNLLHHPLSPFHTSDSDSEDEPHSTDGDADSSGDLNFNTTIPSLHSYLGDVEDTRHRSAFLDGGAIVNLPLFRLPGVVLFPGATLPLRVVESCLVAAVERALSQVDVPYTVGVIRIHRDTATHRIRSASIGTTAEIRQYGRQEHGSVNVVTRGQQRFRLRRCWNDVDGVPYGEIQIIDEDIPLRTPRDAFGKLAPLSNVRCSRDISHTLSSKDSHVKIHGSKNGENDSEANSDESYESELSLRERKIPLSVSGSSFVRDMMDESTNSNDVKVMHKSDQEIRCNLDLRTGNCSTSGKQSSKEEELNRHCKSIHAYPSHKFSKAFWPHWAYRMFDSYWLAQRAADMWKQIVGVPGMDHLIKKPDVLSFHIASKIPVSESTRQELLDINGIAYRLRREIELLKSIDLIRCKSCHTIISKRSDMLVMSSDGPLGAYVNPGGYVHEIMTLYKANGLGLLGPAVTEYSWFPGYAWTIAICATCKIQMGWLFTATNRKLKPISFWGIRSCQVAEEIRRNL